MNIRNTFISAMAMLALVGASGCAVTRGQETVGAYIDDTAITTAVKARFVENQMVDAAAISVETLKGTVRLSGGAKAPTERRSVPARLRTLNELLAEGLITQAEYNDMRRKILAEL